MRSDCRIAVELTERKQFVTKHHSMGMRQETDNVKRVIGIKIQADPEPRSFFSKLSSNSHINSSATKNAVQNMPRTQNNAMKPEQKLGNEEVRRRTLKVGMQEQKGGMHKVPRREKKNSSR